MEWVEVTAKTLDAAKDRALDQLGVGRDEAEFEVLEEPRSGLFGLMRGEARVRARVQPTSVRPKQERRRRPKKASGSGGRSGDRPGEGNTDSPSRGSKGKKRDGRAPAESDKKNPASTNDVDPSEKAAMTNDHTMEESPVSPAEVADAAEQFLAGLVGAFGLEADVTTSVVGEEIDAEVAGDGLGLMIGPSGRTLNAIQDLTRVSAQRRLGDHATRLRVDVGGYREKRRVALEQFTAKVAADVKESGEAKALEPMSSADRKVVHDTVNSIDGVESRSDGDDPGRRVVIVPAE